MLLVIFCVFLFSNFGCFPVFLEHFIALDNDPALGLVEGIMQIQRGLANGPADVSIPMSFLSSSSIIKPFNLA